MQLQRWPEQSGKAADECAHGWSGCSVSMAGRQKKKSVFMISNTMIANAVIYGGKYEGEKMGYEVIWKNTAKLERDLDLQKGSSSSATSVVIIKCCKQKPK